MDFERLNDLITSEKWKIVNALFQHDPASDSYRIKPEWEHFGAEMLKMQHII